MKLSIVGKAMTRFSDLELDPIVAVMGAETVAGTGVVAMLKVATALPACTVTVAGTVAAAKPLDKLTISPPAGAE